jgi:neutral ceramidase
MLRIGFGRVDITPELGLRMAGTEPWPAAEGVSGPLHGRVLLADDGTRRVAIVCLDLMALAADEVALLRSRLAPLGGLDPAAIMVACSHTHAASFTFLAGPVEEPDVLGYLDDLSARMETAMATGAADLRPAELVVARTLAPGWAFNRRPIYAGDQVATHGPTWGEGFVGLEDTPDEEVQVLLAREPGGAVLGGLLGFACHPTVMEAQPVYSSDFAGALVAELEARHGGVFGFLLGASGDTANLDPADRDPDRWFGWAHALRMGRALADRTDEALGASRAVAAARVGVATTRLRIAQRRPTPEQVRLARWYLEEAPADLDELAFTRRFYGHDYTFYEVPPRANERHVRQLLGMWEWQRRAGTRQVIEDVEVQALLLGDVAVVAYPVELFTAFGRRLKADSPFADTFVATMANGWHGYAPTPAAFGRGGYEPFLAYQSRLIPEAGDLMTDAAIELLQEFDKERR